MKAPKNPVLNRARAPSLESAAWGTRAGDDFAARVYVAFDLPLERMSFLEGAKLREITDEVLAPVAASDYGHPYAANGDVSRTLKVCHVAPAPAKAL